MSRMVHDYVVGDKILWCDMVGDKSNAWDPTGHWLDGVVTAVHEEVDEHGSYMYLDIELYNGRTRRLHIPEIDSWLRRRATRP